MHQNVDIFAQLENLLYHGQIKNISKLINTISYSELSPTQILLLVRQLKKSNKNEEALHLLRNFLDLSNMMNPDYYPELQIEYAACLINKEISTVAIQILNKFDYRKFPQILLHQTLGYFIEHNYHSALPLIEAYCKCENLAYHDRLTGFVNHAMALLHDRQFEKAQSLLSKLIPQLSDESVQKLLAECYVLLAQTQVYLGGYKNAAISILRSEHVLNKFDYPNQLNRKMWKLIIWSLQNKKKSLFFQEKFLQLNIEVKGHNDFELNRDLDAWLSVLLQNKELFQFVFFGTSSHWYRNILLTTFDAKNCIPNFYYRTYGKTNKNTPLPKIDLFHTQKQTGDKQVIFISDSEKHSSENNGPNSKGRFHSSAVSIKLSQLLCSDFYRPFSLGRIFNHLFPLEIFDPLTDPQRIYEQIRLTNLLFREKNLPLKITSTSCGYMLNSTSPCQLVIPKDTAVFTEIFETTLLRKSQNNAFTSREAQLWTNTPTSTLNRKLNGLVKAGFLFKLGSGKSIKYIWKKFELNTTEDKSKIS